MKQNIENADADLNKIELRECFEMIGMQTFFRIRAENQVAQLQKINEELQKMMKAQVEPKKDKK